ncbi:APC family permease [Brachybacterium paraconglomeratum]|uniref:APC family permease n=1 Tax=Brachybacterium paraconglomeratum TaxID=173362 RepID=UPI0021A3008D|nr:APC family permease [Brachybacterium paraconglomeratum]MCT1910215.1 APC family permease [Brachybacterium paraconglomeratum]
MRTEMTRSLGVAGIVLMVVAAAAPITVVVANFPLILLESGSIGAPLMILAATLILLLFAVGFTWMTPHVPDAGAFYAYVHQGLGRRAGLGTAAVALLSYVLLTVSMTCYLGVQAGNLLALWTGIELPWWLISAVMIAVVGVLAHRRIDLSAAVLGVVLVLEILAVLAIDLGVLASGRELTPVPFSPAEALPGAPGLGLLFAFLGFFGFEATAVFRHEARDPLRTIPRATYVAVLLIGVLYTVSSWLVISGLGAEDALDAAAASPDSVVVALAGDVVAPIMRDVTQVLVVTSMFACMLGFHNIVARYLFTLGRRGVLPFALGQVHPVHRAPSRASLTVTGITAAIVLVSALAQLDPVVEIYTWYSGLGAIGVIAMMALTALAVLRFGGRRAGALTLAATGLGGLGLFVVLGISLANFPLMVGGTVAAIVCAALLVGAFVLGAVAGPTRSTGAPEDGDAGAETTVGGTTADDEATVGGAGEDPGLTTDGRRR